MKPRTLVGAVLVAFGLIALLFRSGIHYNASETYPHDGPTQVVTKQEKVVTIPLVVSALAILGGVGLMLTSKT